jgi:hypothetical protein
MSVHEAMAGFRDRNPNFRQKGTNKVSHGWVSRHGSIVLDAGNLRRVQ